MEERGHQGETMVPGSHEIERRGDRRSLLSPRPCLWGAMVHAARTASMGLQKPLPFQTANRACTKN